MKTSIRALKADYVRSRLDYDPDTGILTWRPKTIECIADELWNKKKAGNVAGSLQDNGEWFVFLDAILYLASIVVWIITNGYYLIVDIVHRDGNTLNNRIDSFSVYSGALLEIDEPPTPKKKALEITKTPRSNTTKA